jgi:integrase/recombinase XerD
MKAPVVLSVDRYLDALRVQGAAETTIQHRRRHLDRFFAYLHGCGVHDERAVTREHIGGYLLSLAKCAAGTRLTYLSTVRGWFRYLEKTDALLVNPCAGLVLRGVDRMPRRVLTKAQARKILAMPDVRRPRGQRDRAVLEMFYSTGLRRAELRALSVYDVDVAQGYVRVTRGKGGKDRIVPLGKRACAAVRAYIEGARAAWVKNNPQTALWLSCENPHPPLANDGIVELVARHAAAAGVKASAHVWRHTCATHLVARGAALPFVQRLLGHASLETTQIYTRVTAGEVKAMHGKSHPRRRAKSAVAVGSVDDMRLYRKWR